MRLIANAVTGPPGHAHLSSYGRSLDNSYNKVILSDASISNCKISSFPALKLTDDRYALPIINQLLESVAVLLYAVAAEERISRIHYDGLEFFLWITRKGKGDVGAITALSRPTTSHYITQQIKHTNSKVPTLIVIIFMDGVPHC